VEVLVPGKRFAVFSIREGKNGAVWVRAGTAFVNKDGSMNVYLDVLPIDGKLHVRDAGEKRDAAPSGISMDANNNNNGAADSAAEQIGGH
jgi:hypothetical protein